MIIQWHATIYIIAHIAIQYLLCNSFFVDNISISPNKLKLLSYKVSTYSYLFHAETGSNCSIILNQKYFYYCAKYIKEVDVSGSGTARTEGFGDIYFYFSKKGKYHLFYYDKAYYILTNGINTFSLLVLKRTGILVISHAMNQYIFIYLKDKTKLFILFDHINNYQYWIEITMILPLHMTYAIFVMT